MPYPFPVVHLPSSPFLPNTYVHRLISRCIPDDAPIGLEGGSPSILVEEGLPFSSDKGNRRTDKIDLNLCIVVFKKRQDIPSGRAENFTLLKINLLFP
jgi:hypothetical protein